MAVRQIRPCASRSPTAMRECDERVMVDKPLLIAGRERERQPEGWGMPMPLLHQPLTAINEDPLIAAILKNAGHREMFLNIRGIASVEKPLTAVPLSAFDNGLRGDVDVLVVPPGAPEKSVAIQVKRIKIDAKAIRGEKSPNGLHLYEKGIKQANLCHAVGFSIVYLYVIFLFDTREQNAGRLTYDGATPDLIARITNRLTTKTVRHPHVGEAHFEFVQPMDHAPLTTGSSHLALRHLATEQTQPAALTEWLKTLA